jgi:hypothetical protein
MKLIISLKIAIPLKLEFHLLPIAFEKPALHLHRSGFFSISDPYLAQHQSFANSVPFCLRDLYHGILLDPQALKLKIINLLSIMEKFDYEMTRMSYYSTNSNELLWSNQAFLSLHSHGACK